jgi:putative SOS response-associated peptidase YedK
MCNLYSMTESQQEIRDLVKAICDLASNPAPLLAVFPDKMAPVVRTAPDEVREQTMMRRGFPAPPSGNRAVTNIRNTSSRWWRPWLKDPSQRCLVPVTSFAESDNNQRPRSIWTWFAQDESRPLMFFAGAWREWQGKRGTKAESALGNHLLFSFLTTDASPDVAPIHPDPTHFLLLDEDARELWMNAPMVMALSLRRPPPTGTLRVVAAGEREDGG